MSAFYSLLKEDISKLTFERASVANVDMIKDRILKALDVLTKKERKERKERSFQAILDNHEIELRTSKDNENENSEARDNVRFDKMIL
ncbi:13623_t:CDS:2 [Rhizophagus irregularis]|nr:13623_t:CDS:2 [Rhizophagus irregularis]